MAKRDLLKLPDDFEGNMRALLGDAAERGQPEGSQTAEEREEEAAETEHVEGSGGHLRLRGRAGAQGW
jgi:hypothetical protein